MFYNPTAEQDCAKSGLHTTGAKTVLIPYAKMPTYLIAGFKSISNNKIVFYPF